MKLKSLFAFALPVVGIAAYAAVNHNDWLAGTARPAQVFDAQPVQRGQIRKLVATSGPVRALVTVQVGSQLSGLVVELKADFNTEVKEGDILAVIDDKTFVAKVAQAEADLAAAKASLENMIAAELKAEATMRQAERTIARARTLAAKGITAQATLDTATRDIDIAKADMAVAKAQIANARANVAQREAQLLQARIDLDRTRIRSPINGTVISRTVDLGQTVAASLQAPELFRIAQDLRLIRIEAQVNEADVGAVKEGNAVSFTVDAYPERQFTGRVAQVRLAATELQNIVTYTVIVEAENEDRSLFPGMTANVQIETARRDGVLRVPADAIRFKPRTPVAGGGEEGSGGRGKGDGQQRMERLKADLKLSDAQAAEVRAEMQKAFAELRQSRESGQWTDPNADRKLIQNRIEQTLRRILTEEQRPLLAAWLAKRETARFAPIHVLDAEGRLQRRNVRIGIADEQFTEVLEGLKEGDRVVTKARDATKK